MVQNRPKKEIETEANQKPNACRAAMDKGLDVNCKIKVQQEEDVKVQSSMTDNVVVKTVITSAVDNLKPPILTRSRSSRRSRDLDLNPEALLNPPPQSYTSLLLEDIHNFHQKNTPPVSLPACVTKACAILEAVADLNSNTSSNCSRHGYQSSKSEYNVLFGTTNDHGKRVPEPDTKDPLAEYESFVNDDVMEPSLHNYVTVNRDGSLGGVDMEDQESSGSNSFTQQQHYIQGISSSSWEPSSGDSKYLCTSRLNNSREQGQKLPLGLEGRVSREAARDVDGARNQLNSKKNVCDHQHGSRIGRGRVGGNKVLHTRPVVAAAEST
uniref:Uncharacterized protein n=1 Tax=Lotus japonicus TaxID=34305 RepID=I3T804_LOTJA|nr:unknown [Lotus japonicus]